ncbi:hypothetical protein L1887_34440 [Cichorium endivia]|nr:hypothetical protein L1887_34440 [Cichorium endivia]
MFKGAKNYLRMTTDPTASEAANKLINSDLKEIGDATKKFANHVIQLGVSGGFITTSLQWFACFAAIYLLILDRTNWRTNMLTALLVPYIFLTLPSSSEFCSKISAESNCFSVHPSSKFNPWRPQSLQVVVVEPHQSHREG